MAILSISFTFPRPGRTVPIFNIGCPILVGITTDMPTLEYRWLFQQEFYSNLYIYIPFF